MNFTLPLYFLFGAKFPSRFCWELSPKFPARSLTQPIFMEYLSLIAQLVKNPPAMQVTPVWFLGREDTLEKGLATQSSILGLPLSLSWQRIHLQCGRPGFDPWVGKITWRRERLCTSVFWPGKLYRLYSPWGCKKIRLSDFHVHIWFWRMEWQPTPVFLPGDFPWTEKTGRLQSMESQRVGHN